MELNKIIPFLITISENILSTKKDVNFKKVSCEFRTKIIVKSWEKINIALNVQLHFYLFFFLYYLYSLRTKRN